MEEKYTKKANAYIMKAVLKVKPNASKLTSYDQAFVILMEDWDLEGTMETDTMNHTVFGLYRDGDVVKKYEWDGLWIAKEGDWDWTTIYKEVLEDIIKHRLYKRPKISKRAKAKIEKEKAEKKALEEKMIAEAVAKENAIKEENEIKRLIRNLKMRVYDRKKKNKDYSDLELEIKELESKFNDSKTAVKQNQIKKTSKCVAKEKEAVKSKENKKSIKRR